MQVRINEWVYITGQVTLCIARLIVCAVILDNVIRMYRHRANLGTKISLYILTFKPGRLLFTSLLLSLIEASPEQFHCYFAVLYLRAFILTGNHDARRNMPDAYCRVGLVDVLSASACRAIRVYFNILGTNRNLYRILDVRHDLDLGKGSMAAMCGIKG